VNQWSKLESGEWIPAFAGNIWFSLAGVLQVGFERLLHIAACDVVRKESFKKSGQRMARM
jgi:hypothetical protein